MYLFDLDGTLVDSNGIWFQIDLDFLAQRGLAPDPEYTDFVAHATYQDAAVYTQRRYHLMESPEEILQIWADMARDAYAHTIPLKPGVLDYLLQQKAAGKRLGVVTSCMRHLCRAVLEQHGIYELFDHVTTVKEVTRDKSHPDIYLLAAEKGGVRPQDCTVFEDSPSAADGAKAAGMRVVGVYDSFFAPREEEMRRKCDVYIHSFEEICL